MKIYQVTAILVLMVVSFIVGTRVGVDAFQLSSAKVEGQSATAALQTFSPENCKRYLEVKRDKSLIWQGYNQQSPLRVIWPELNDEKSESVVSYIAKYRAEHPTQYPPEGLQLSTEQLELISKEKAILEKVTNEYSR